MAEPGWNESSFLLPQPMTDEAQRQYQYNRLHKDPHSHSSKLREYVWDPLIEYYYRRKCVTTGWIPPTLEEYEEALEKLKRSLVVMKKIGRIKNIDESLISEIDKGTEYIEIVSSPLAKGTKTFNHVAAAVELIEATKVLHKWGANDASVSSQEAAAAFDKAFGALATFLDDLGPPLSMFSAIFAEIAKNNFFSKFVDMSEAYYRRAYEASDDGLTPGGVHY